MIDRGLIERVDYGDMSLTEKGRALAEEILNRHETLKAYLIKLGVNEKIAEEDCCRIEHSISEETFLAISHELETKK